ncbi:glycerol-3-phosphate responsive antiterminator [Paenibacillus yanchengensis]|uniref:Glycerol uptake operon antiterminator regulatory protein n=1 Tax=Paenibacillus yanchengensis TaxID=2035833 RepID=A0ABW4YP66_9BACL
MPKKLAGQRVLPATSRMKDMEAILASPFTYMVLLGGRLGQLKPIVDVAKKHGKQVLLHADLIDGLKNDEYAAEFLCQTIQPAGLISTRASVIKVANKNGLLAILRLFAIDSEAIERNFLILEKYQPDYIEILPGIVPEVIEEIKQRTQVPIIAGGLIKTEQHVEQALAAGATAITTSRKQLWVASYAGEGKRDE